METSGSNKRTDAEMNQLKNDPSFLIKSLREKMLLRIEEINSGADSEIKQIDEDLRVELEKFRRIHKEYYDNRIQYEESRAGNLASIEMKKQRLEIMEFFINTVISGIVSLLRADDRYFSFLIECIIRGIKEVKGRSATVIISDDDLKFCNKIMDEISRAGYNLSVKIEADPRALSGGALVVDDETEVIFNNSVERIIYRKKGELRREILKDIKEFRL